MRKMIGKKRSNLRDPPFAEGVDGSDECTPQWEAASQHCRDWWYTDSEASTVGDTDSDGEASTGGDTDSDGETSDDSEPMHGLYQNDVGELVFGDDYLLELLKVPSLPPHSLRL